jgi:uncharacterized protein
MGRQDNQGGRGGQGGRDGSSDDRGFAGMSDEEERRIAQKGGEASARQQDRDEEGRFAGSDDSGGRGRSGGQGGGNRSGGSGGSRSQGGSRSEGGSNR